MLATGWILASARTNILGAALAAVGTSVGSGARSASTAACATCAAAGSATGPGACSCTCAGAGTRASPCPAARLRVGQTDRRTGKQRTYSHRENCLSHFSTPFDVDANQPKLHADVPENWRAASMMLNVTAPAAGATLLRCLQTIYSRRIFRSLTPMAIRDLVVG